MTQRERYSKNVKFQKAVTNLLDFIVDLIEEEKYSLNEVVDAGKLATILYHEQKETKTSALYKKAVSLWLNSEVINE